LIPKEESSLDDLKIEKFLDWFDRYCKCIVLAYMKMNIELLLLIWEGLGFGNSRLLWQAMHPNRPMERGIELRILNNAN
jgi:hypothetical protein